MTEDLTKPQQCTPTKRSQVYSPSKLLTYLSEQSIHHPPTLVHGPEVRERSSSQYRKQIHEMRVSSSSRSCLDLGRVLVISPPPYSNHLPGITNHQIPQDAITQTIRFVRKPGLQAATVDSREDIDNGQQATSEITHNARLVEWCQHYYTLRNWLISSFYHLGVFFHFLELNFSSCESHPKKDEKIHSN